jgi:hypothetical protein
MECSFKASSRIRSDYVFYCSIAVIKRHHRKASLEDSMDRDRLVGMGGTNQVVGLNAPLRQRFFLVLCPPPREAPLTKTWQISSPTGHEQGTGGVGVYGFCIVHRTYDAWNLDRLISFFGLIRKPSYATTTLVRSLRRRKKLATRHDLFVL